MTMIDSKETTSTRPYLIRALYEWCTDNGLTPYATVAVNEHVQVPLEFVKDGEIVLNISIEATTSLKLGNEYLEFKARFGGVARDIFVPIERISGIFARENGQGMAFPIDTSRITRPSPPVTSVKQAAPADAPLEGRSNTLVSVESSTRHQVAEDRGDTTKPPAAGKRPTLTRIK